MSALSGGVPFHDLPFAYRILILVAVLGVIAGVDLLRRGREATRWREYAYLLAFAAVAGAFGSGVDAVTSRISPEYFLVGKGIEGGDGFERRVLALGFHAAFLGGAVAGGCFLLANQPGKAGAGTSRPPLSYRTLTLLTLLPAATTAAGGLIAGGVLAIGVAAPLVERMDLPVSGAAAEPFLIVWGTLTGVYAGCLIGVVAGVVRIRRLRARARPA